MEGGDLLLELGVHVRDPDRRGRRRRPGAPRGAADGHPAHVGPGARGAVLARWRTTPGSTARACSTCAPARARSGWRRCRAARRTRCFVESDRRAAAVLRRNVADLGLPGAVVAAPPAAAVLARTADRAYDVVLVDPPYDVPDREVAGWLAAAARPRLAGRGRHRGGGALGPRRALPVAGDAAASASAATATPRCTSGGARRTGRTGQPTECPDCYRPGP